ncbi:MAG: hypothetical protein JNK21_15075 [Rhodospirillaceae bacterium]|nr:hypothetical protein [Rhodospirillaceae bacterium]
MTLEEFGAWSDAAIVSSSIIAFITAVFVAYQVREIRRATYATAFKAVYDILQSESVRAARGFVFDLQDQKKEFKDWDENEKKKAEVVCHNYDCIGIMCRNGLIPARIVADSWGDSLRRLWVILYPLVREYRYKKNADEYWDDFQWLAKKAEKFQKKIW